MGEGASFQQQQKIIKTHTHQPVCFPPNTTTPPAQETFSIFGPTTGHSSPAFIKPQKWINHSIRAERIFALRLCASRFGYVSSASCNGFRTNGICPFYPGKGKAKPQATNYRLAWLNVPFPFFLRKFHRVCGQDCRSRLQFASFVFAGQRPVEGCAFGVCSFFFRLAGAATRQIKSHHEMVEIRVINLQEKYKYSGVSSGPGGQLSHQQVTL